MIYLDNAATTVLHPQAAEVYSSVAEMYYGNSNSMHDIGSNAAQITEASALSLSKLIRSKPGEIYFTSGATESNYLGIHALLSAKDGKHIITTGIEHSSVTYTLQQLEEIGYSVTRIPVNENGRVDLNELKTAIRPDTVLASIQFVNSETGVIQDIEAIGEILNEQSVYFHTDAVQAFGRLPIDVSSLKVDALTVSGHKIYGPKGIGMLYIRSGIDWRSPLPVPRGPRKLTAGTANVPAIASMTAAAKLAHADMDEEQERIGNLRETLIKELRKLNFEMIVEGDEVNQIPNILGLRFPGMEGQYMMLECNQAGLAISTGSACKVGSEEPSVVMTATGKDGQDARQFIRLSFGRYNKIDEIPRIVESINTILVRHFKKVNKKDHQKQYTS